MVVLLMQISSLKKDMDTSNLVSHLRDMWINNGDHISRIYTGTGALGQRSKVMNILKREKFEFYLN